LEENRKLSPDRLLQGCQLSFLPLWYFYVVLVGGTGDVELCSRRRSWQPWRKQLLLGTRRFVLERQGGHKRWSYQIPYKSWLQRTDPFVRSLILHLPLLFHLSCALPASKVSHLHWKAYSPRSPTPGGSLSCCLPAHQAG